MAATIASHDFLLLCKQMKVVGLLSRARSISGTQILNSPASTSSVSGATVEEIVIPKKKKRDDLAVLRALNSTVTRDVTASSGFIDDPFLTPISAAEKKRFSLAKDSGRKAAQFVLKQQPELFHAYQKDEPRIEAYYPPLDSYVFEGPSEEAIMERAERLEWDKALEMYKKLNDGGTPVSDVTRDALFDAMCFHGCKPPVPFLKVDMHARKTTNDPDEAPVEEPTAEEPEGDIFGVGKNQEFTWQDGNEAELLFDSIESPTSFHYNSMIRGLIKHNREEKGFQIYQQARSLGIVISLAAYNALIASVDKLQGDYRSRWTHTLTYLKNMQIDGVRPDLFTFNKLLKSLGGMGFFGQTKSIQVPGEMRAVGVEPSLGTYRKLLEMFFRNPSQTPAQQLLYYIMDEIEDKKFELKDPALDVFFFPDVMSHCLKLRDIEMAYRVDAFLEKGHHGFLNSIFRRQYYYTAFLQLIILEESVETMMHYYRKFVPAITFPISYLYESMLKAICHEKAFQIVPELWRDNMSNTQLRLMKINLVERFLDVCASSEIDDKKLLTEMTEIGDDTLKILKVYEPRKESRFFRPNAPTKELKISSSFLCNLMMIFLRGDQFDKAKRVLKLFKEKNHSVLSQNVSMEFMKQCAEKDDVKACMDCLNLVRTSSPDFIPSLVDVVKDKISFNSSERAFIEQLIQETDGEGQ